MMMKAEIIDGVRVPGWKMTQWVLMDRVRYGIYRRKQAAWMRAARLLPRELRKWVVVHAACAVWVSPEQEITPDLITYERMYKAVEPRPGR